MKKEFREYHPNGEIKHIICYDDNGGRDYEQFYDENGKYHREDGLPTYQKWYENGILYHKAFLFHGKLHNIYNPADICLLSNGKINEKYHNLKQCWRSCTKLNWMNKIKNI